MAKEVVARIKLQVPGGQATPAPPVGPALGQHGVKPGEFINQFNERTRDAQGMIIPVVIDVYKDKSFTFVTKSPPAAVLLKKAAGLVKGSGQTGREAIGKVTMSQVEEIARAKEKDLNAGSLAGAVKIILGTARSMGLEVETDGGQG